ncbi:hypothetical protein LCGC14_2716690, partial [marine sediment metagenome]
MTTIERYKGMDRVMARLESVRKRHFLVQLAQAGAGMLTLGLGTLVVLGTMGFWPSQPPAALRWPMLIAALGLWVLGLGWFALRTIRRRLNYAQTARLIEQGVGEVRNGLINAVQLSTDQMQPSPAMVQKVIDETLRRTAKVPLARAVKMRSLKRWTISASTAAAVMLVFAIFWGPQLQRGLAAAFNPGGYVRHVGSVKLISLTPGDTTVFAGEDLTIVAKVVNPDRRRLIGRVQRAGRPGALPAFASPDRSTFSCPLGKAEQTFQYAVRIGDSKFPADRPYYTVTVLQRVDVEGLDLLYRFPKYTNKPDENVVNADGPIEAPVGTTVKATLRLSAPVPAVVLVTRSDRKIAMRADSDGKAYTGILHVTGDDAYRIVLTDSAGRRLQQLPD